MKKRQGPSELTPEQAGDAERLRALLGTAPRGIQSKVTAELQMTPAAISQQVKGWRPLNLKTAAAFARHLGVDIERVSPRLAREAQMITAPGAQSSMRVEEPLSAPYSLGKRRVPVISYVQAGLWSEASDPYQAGAAEKWIDCDLDLPDSAFALRIKGDSMLPDFRDGDEVIVDPAKAPRPGSFVVAKNGEHEATFKKYRPRGLNDRGEQVFELVPLNDDYPTLHSDRQRITIIGVVVQHRRNF